MFGCSNFHSALCSISASFMKSRSGCWEEQSVLYREVKSTCRGAGFRVKQNRYHLSDTQLKRLEVIQNEGMRAILGCTKDTSAAAMRYTLDLPTMATRYRLAQVRAYLKVSADTKPTQQTQKRKRVDEPSRHNH